MLNLVVLQGNLTCNPKLSCTPNQTAVVDFGLATNRRWMGQDGSSREETCFVDCRAFGKIAENINKYFKKGSQILIKGRLRFDSWQAQDGSKRSKLSVTCTKFNFVGQKTGQAGQKTGQTATAYSDHASEGSWLDDCPFS